MLTRPEGLATRVLLWAGAADLVVSRLVHLHLWDIAYRHVDTLGPRFMVQGIVALVLAIGTLAGYVKALNGGIFGFTLPVVTGWANLALVAELCAIVVLGAASWLMLAQRSQTDRVPTPSPSGA